MFERKEYWKKYYKKNRERLLKEHREWRSKNNPEYMKQWRLKNPEKVKEIRKRCYEKKKIS
ncbi:hypothetical protein ES703_120654 [subsurface metagenome]